MMEYLSVKREDRALCGNSLVNNNGYFVAHQARIIVLLRGQLYIHSFINLVKKYGAPTLSQIYSRGVGAKSGENKVPPLQELTFW